MTTRDRGQIERFIIDCSALARIIAETFYGSLASRVYEVSLSDTGTLQWLVPRDGNMIMNDKEPRGGFWRLLAASRRSRHDEMADQ